MRSRFPPLHTPTLSGHASQLVQRGARLLSAFGSRRFSSHLTVLGFFLVLLSWGHLYWDHKNGLLLSFGESSEVISLSLVASQNKAGDLTKQSLDRQPTDRAMQDWKLFEYQAGESLVYGSHIRQSTDPDLLAEREKEIYDFFQRKWRGGKDLATEFDAEFELLAHYYAQHDLAYALIQRLKRRPLYFDFLQGNFRSDVKGDALRVRSVNVLFDPRSAAVLGNDVAVDNKAAGDGSHIVHQHTASRISAADALLHELLHADIALNQSKHFIASGAMQSFYYPLVHERQVIALERELFTAMSIADGIERPIRHSHVGYLVSSSCATCLK